MANAKITDLANATALTGAELVETVQGGVNKKTTTQDIANLAGSSGHVIEDEGTPLTTRTKLNFVGAGVTVTDDSGDDATVVTIPGGGGSGTVESVTGDGVDNTDPDNPVLSFPTLSDLTDVQAALDAKTDSEITSYTKTANYTLTSSDLTDHEDGKPLKIRMNVASANDFTIPPESSVNFPIGFIGSGEQMGAGQTTIVPGSGVTMRSPFNANKTYAQYSKFYYEKIGADEWLISGDITV